MPWDHTIIYETHVRGYTKRHPDVAEHQRGTFAGLGDARRSSTTSSRSASPRVELLPVHTFVNDSHLLERGLTQLLGLQQHRLLRARPALRRRSAPTALREFKEMVARFHDAGLEVILDVVYNHTAEGNERGPTLSFKGIDNASYYRLLPDNKRYYINDTGTGNTLNLSHPRVIQMVTDSLRYWVSEMHVDGFRFDLGTILAREPNGFDNHSGFLKACMQDPVLRNGEADRRAVGLRPRRLSGRRLSARLGRVERQVPRHGARFLAAARRRPATLAPRLCASADVFNHRGRKAVGERQLRHRARRLHAATISSATTRSTTRRTARTTSDGTRDNRSWNCGAEGPTDDPAINALRERQMRNMLATLLLSQGTPMLLAGDEFGRTQQGNNNAYCQDNEISWVDWDRDRARAQRTDQLRAEADLRCAHEYPILRRSRFLTGEYNEELGVKDVTWINAIGRRDARRGLGRRQHALLRHAARRPRAADRHRQRGERCDAADRAERAPRPRAVHAARATGRRTRGRC